MWIRNRPGRKKTVRYVSKVSTDLCTCNQYSIWPLVCKVGASDLILNPESSVKVRPEGKNHQITIQNTQEIKRTLFNKTKIRRLFFFFQNAGSQLCFRFFIKSRGKVWFTICDTRHFISTLQDDEENEKLNKLKVEKVETQLIWQYTDEVCKAIFWPVLRFKAGLSHLGVSRFGLVDRR